MINEIQAVQIITTRGLSVLREKDGKWRAYIGSDAATSNSFASPLDAIEEADRIILSSETRAKEVKLRRLFAAVETAIYAPWPRIKGDGSIEWSVLRTSDRQPVQGVGVQSGLLPALLRIAELVGQPVEDTDSVSSGGAGSGVVASNVAVVNGEKKQGA